VEPGRDGSWDVGDRRTSFFGAKLETEKSAGGRPSCETRVSEMDITTQFWAVFQFFGQYFVENFCNSIIKKLQQWSLILPLFFQNCGRNCFEPLIATLTISCHSLLSRKTDLSSHIFNGDLHICIGTSIKIRSLFMFATNTNRLHYVLPIKYILSQSKVSWDKTIHTRYHRHILRRM
jgi:hypothetical protein